MRLIGRTGSSVRPPSCRREVANDLIDDPETFAGLPISLQLVGRRFEDEKIIAVLEYIKEHIALPFVPFP
jgi:amidase